MGLPLWAVQVDGPSCLLWDEEKSCQKELNCCGLFGLRALKCKLQIVCGGLDNFPPIFFAFLVVLLTPHPSLSFPFKLCYYTNVCQASHIVVT